MVKLLTIFECLIIGRIHKTYHCLGKYQSVFLMDSHHPPTEILADACRKTLEHLTAAQPTNMQFNFPIQCVHSAAQHSSVSKQPIIFAYLPVGHSIDHGSEKPRFCKKKPNPLGFGLYWVFQIFL